MQERMHKGCTNTSRRWCRGEFGSRCMITRAQKGWGAGDVRPGHTSSRAPWVPRSTSPGGRGNWGAGECQTSRDNPEESELTAVRHLKQE